jgi:hypothetical protein
VANLYGDDGRNRSGFRHAGSDLASDPIVLRSRLDAAERDDAYDQCNVGAHRYGPTIEYEDALRGVGKGYRQRNPHRDEHRIDA